MDSLKTTIIGRVVAEWHDDWLAQENCKVSIDNMDNDFTYTNAKGNFKIKMKKKPIDDFFYTIKFEKENFITQEKTLIKIKNNQLNDMGPIKLEPMPGFEPVGVKIPDPGIGPDSVLFDNL